MDIWLTNLIHKYLPKEDWMNLSTLLDQVTEAERKKLMALAYNKKTSELSQMIEDLKIYKLTK